MYPHNVPKLEPHFTFLLFSIYQQYLFWQCKLLTLYPYQIIFWNEVCNCIYCWQAFAASILWELHQVFEYLLLDLVKQSQYGGRESLSMINAIKYFVSAAQEIIWYTYLFVCYFCRKGNFDIVRSVTHSSRRLVTTYNYELRYPHPMYTNIWPWFWYFPLIATFVRTCFC